MSRSGVRVERRSPMIHRQAAQDDDSGDSKVIVKFKVTGAVQAPPHPLRMLPGCWPFCRQPFHRCLLSIPAGHTIRRRSGGAKL